MTLETGMTEYVVKCDYPGCEAEGFFYTYSRTSAADEFRSCGWQIPRRRLPPTMYMKCYCPEHIKRTKG